MARTDETFMKFYVKLLSIRILVYNSNACKVYTFFFRETPGTITSSIRVAFRNGKENNC